MPTTHSFEVARSTGTNRQKFTTLDVEVPDSGTDREFGLVAKLEEQHDHADFSGAAAVGTIQMTGSLPAGALVVATKVTVEEGFAGDTSAALTIGDGSDVDRYNTGTLDVFSTAATGVEAGVPSGALLLTSANRPTLTITTNAAWSSVTAGKVTVAIYYIQA